MKIGIDARSLSYGLTGIGYYLLEVIKELKKLDVHITLFSTAPLLVPADSLTGISVITGSSTKPIPHLIWSELQLPLLLKKHLLDIFWGPAHRFPILMPLSQATALTIHDLVWRKVPGTMRLYTRLQETLFMPRSLQRADIILADSTSTASDLLDYRPAFKDKIRYVPPGRGNSFLQALDDRSKCQRNPLFSSWSSKLNKPYILFTGTIEPRKNLARLLAGFSALPKDLRQAFQLVIAGGKGWGTINLQDEIQKYKLTEQVIVTGYVSEKELSRLYAGAYCLAMPSLYEGFGMPILEANSFGVPVITSNTSSMPEVAGDAAILVDPLEIEDITRSLRMLLENRGLRETLSRRAIENAQRYSWEKTARLTLDAFKEAINSRNQRRKEV
uniref:Glycosyltransferase involved in cell wall bisynthesis n=1 Tax=Candidatus Kentrum sp. UNK TaxID=2126344 RepID=A0A451AY07_9GAMM|nr:MAG: Glycosyltransferase involved in cell wall bisynthesis [Candidatus Kentron sp. UNK]VFK70930.1 MAG: Glycosyltransferase involved in cell wall bisynthesis [Candidatus Kentron sp. UNK]